MSKPKTEQQVDEQASGSPKRKKSRLSFGLLTLLLLMIPLGLAFLKLSSFLERDPSTVTAMKLKQHLDDGKIVVIFIDEDPRYKGVPPTSSRRTSYDSPETRRLIRSRDIVSLKLEGDHSYDPDVQIPDVDLPSVPGLYVYGPGNRNQPIEVRYGIALSEVLERLRSSRAP